MGCSGSKFWWGGTGIRILDLLLERVRSVTITLRGGIKNIKNIVEKYF